MEHYETTLKGLNEALHKHPTQNISKDILLFCQKNNIKFHTIGIAGDNIHLGANEMTEQEFVDLISKIKTEFKIG